MAPMDEQELQAFLDQVMHETAAENHVPETVLDDALRAAESEREPDPQPEPAVPQEEPSEPEPAAQPEAKPAPESTDDSGKKPHPVRDAVIGVILVLFAGLGLYTAVRAGISLVQRLSAQPVDSRIAQVQECILPLAVMDIPEFDDPEALSDAQLLTAAVWSAVTSGKLGSYPENLGMRVIPASELTAIGNQLFGTVRSPEYQSIGFSGDIRFYYDKEQQSYLVPADPRVFTYVPTVTALHDTDTGVTAEVAYYAQEPVWQAEQRELIKTVEFTLTQTDSGAWQVRALRQIG